jgi:hypothetical protein
VAAINAELAKGGDHVLLAGDSDIALLGTPEPPRGLGVVNAGVGGIKADGYLALLGRLRLSRPPRLGAICSSRALQCRNWVTAIPISNAISPTSAIAFVMSSASIFS